MFYKIVTIAGLCLLPLFPSSGMAPARVEFKTVQVKEIDAEEVALLILKRWEGLSLSATWDVNSYRNGWGTPAKKGEVITLKEADRRALEYFRNTRERLRVKYSHLGDWELNILAVTAYNVGAFGPKLDRAVKSGNQVKIAEYLTLYIKSAGVVLQGLRNRRSQEAELLTAPPDRKAEILTELQNIVLSHIKKAKK